MSSLFDVTAGSLIGPTTGGTVTQASNKSTGVTLNAESGQITMNGAALGAGAEVSFTVTNSKISSTDVVLVNHSSGGTAGVNDVESVRTSKSPDKFAEYDGIFTKSPPLSAERFNSAKGCTTPLCKNESVCVVASIK